MPCYNTAVTNLTLKRLHIWVLAWHLYTEADHRSGEAAISGLQVYIGTTRTSSMRKTWKNFGDLKLSSHHV